LYSPGQFSVRLEQPGQQFALILTTEASPELDAESALQAERSRQNGLLERADAAHAEPAVRQLVLGADQFLVARDSGRAVIAGYPWFHDLGRDTMISLPGLTLATGRANEAADILRTFARFVDQGMLPNNFPDRS